MQSLAFKYGIPADSDLVFDVRFLPNPFYIQELKEMTGNDEPVSSYVMSFEESRNISEKAGGYAGISVPHYIKEGKNSLVISIGCTAASTALLPLRMPFTRPLERMDTPSFSSIMTLKKDSRHKK